MARTLLNPDGELWSEVETDGDRMGFLSPCQLERDGEDRKNLAIFLQQKPNFVAESSNEKMS